MRRERERVRSARRRGCRRCDCRQANERAIFHEYFYPVYWPGRAFTNCRLVINHSGFLSCSLSRRRCTFFPRVSLALSFSYIYAAQARMTMKEERKRAARYEFRASRVAAHTHTNARICMIVKSLSLSLSRDATKDVIRVLSTRAPGTNDGE